MPVNFKEYYGYTPDNLRIITTIIQDLVAGLRALQDCCLTCFDLDCIEFDGSRYVFTNVEDISFERQGPGYKVLTRRSPYSFLYPNDYIPITLEIILEDLYYTFLRRTGWSWWPAKEKISEFYGRDTYIGADIGLDKKDIKAPEPTLLQQKPMKNFPSNLKLADLPPSVADEISALMRPHEQEGYRVVHNILFFLYQYMQTVNLREFDLVTFRKDDMVFRPLLSLTDDSQPIFSGKFEDGRVFVAKPGPSSKNNFARYEQFPDFDVYVGEKRIAIRATTIMEPLFKITGLSDDELFLYTRDILSELQELHGRGYVHHDIKPENTMQRSDGTYVLIDFDDVGKIGQPREIATPNFAMVRSVMLFNEQFPGNPLDDLIEFGYTLNFLVTGITRFKTTTPTPTSDKVDRYLEYITSFPLTTSYTTLIEHNAYQNCIALFQ